MQMEHRVEIEKIISGGKGLARLADGRVVMIPGVLPGEQVLVRESRKKSDYLEARVTRLLSRSASRTDPRCPRYGICGGCNFQHIAYPVQLRLKKNILAESLKRSRVAVYSETVSTMLASPLRFGYRSRVRMRLDRQGRPGFLAHRSNTVVPISSCPVVTTGLNRAISALAAMNLPDLQTCCRQVDLVQSPLDNSVTAIFFPRRDRDAPSTIDCGVPPADIDHLLVYRNGKLISLVGSANPVLAQHFPACGETVDTRYSLSWEPTCFFQGNPGQNLQLVDRVCRAAGDLSDKEVLDLYCGYGNLTIPLALAGARICGVEHNLAAIRWGRYNAHHLGLDTCRFRSGDVVRTVRQLHARNREFHLVVLDPPRRGMGRAIGLLAELARERIIYVSCDPATMARDLAWLLAGSLFRIRAIEPLDMFPQTHHIESLVLLERN